MAGPRKLHNATLLPDGKVLVTGGIRSGEDPNTKPSDPAYTSEMWDPATGTWLTMASFTLCRSYHSIALLLPDGRVLSAGGNYGGRHNSQQKYIRRLICSKAHVQLSPRRRQELATDNHFS